MAIASPAGTDILPRQLLAAATTDLLTILSTPKLAHPSRSSTTQSANFSTELSAAVQQGTGEKLPLRIDEVHDLRERAGCTFFFYTNSVITKTGQVDILLAGKNSSLGKGRSLLISKQGVLFIVERDGTLSAYQPK